MMFSIEDDENIWNQSRANFVTNSLQFSSLDLNVCHSVKKIEKKQENEERRTEGE